ncbi:MAG: phenylacetate--CoA ligase family protein [Promethearchaeota archaeon]
MIKKELYNLLQKVKGNSFNDQYNQITCIMSEKVLVNFNITQLKEILTHSYKNVLFYFHRLKSANIINSDGYVNLGEFNRIPLLKKDNVRNHRDKLTSKDILRRKWRYNKTSGSIGEPLKVIQDNLEKKWKNATQRYYYEHLIGIDEIAAKKIMFSYLEGLFENNIRFRQKANHWLKNAKYLDVFRMKETDMEHYIKKINSEKPDLIECVPSILFELSRYIERKGKAIYQPKVIVCTSEKLHEHMRETIENVFGTKLYDFYGSRECHALAGECKAGLLHIFTFNNHIEVLNEQNHPVKEGEIGKVVVTPLHNYAMPLIRYEIGDMAILGPKRCKCGSSLPTLKEVVGRSRDFFIKDDGTLIPAGMIFIYLFKLREWIKAFQVVQEDYLKIRISVVPHGSINDVEKREIEQKIKEVMGTDCYIIWEIVDEIPRSQRGKYFYIKSLLYDR